MENNRKIHKAGVRRKISKMLEAIVFSLYLASAIPLTQSCDSGGSSRRRNANPIVYVSSREFENDGNVKYRIIAEDDVDVVEIRTAYNDEPIQHHFSSGIVLTKPVTRERNTLAAIAIDNRGASSNELINTFRIPPLQDSSNQVGSFTQVRELLENAGNYQTLESDINRLPIHLFDRQYNVHFRLTRNDNRYSLINLIGLEDNLQEQRDAQAALTRARIDNLFLYLLPAVEINNRTTEFINADYLTNFE